MYKPIEEQQLITELLTRKDNLIDFVLYVFPWGKKGTPLEHHLGPRKWQKKVLQEITDHLANNTLTFEVFRKAIASGRGIGKSALVSMIIIWMLSTRIGSSVIVSANSEAQLRTVTWGELSKWVSMAINAHWWDISATRLSPKKWMTELVEQQLQKGTRYWGAEGKLWSEENPDSYAGAHNHDGMLVIFDEASGIPGSIWSVANGYFTENIRDRFWLAFSNPRRSEGYFYECFNKRRNFWNTEKIDSRSVEGTDKNLYQQIMDEYGPDSDEAYIEVYGEFPRQGDDYFMPTYLVDDAIEREVEIDESQPIIMGIDPGSGSPDSTGVYVRQGGVTLGIRRYKESNPMRLTGLIVDDIEHFKPKYITIDMGGLGWGIHGRLNELGHKVTGINFGWKAKNPVLWGNTRAEIWGQMREWLEYGALPNDTKLRSDLLGVKKAPNSNGIMFLESKKDMRKRGLNSPDTADALALTFAIKPKTAETLRKKAVSPVVVSWMGV